MLLDSLKTGHDFYTRIWRPSEVVISDMEGRGIGLDVRVCAEEQQATRAQAEKLMVTLEQETGTHGLNWSSPKQVSEYLYGILGLPVPPVCGTARAVQITRDDKRPTSEAALEWLRDHERQGWIKRLLEWKAVTKLGSFWATLPDHIREDGRIHPQLAPSTETGRLSCRNANLQQQPQETRRAFIAKPGHVLLALDYSGLEWRILAHVLAHRYKDFSLVEEIVAGIDPHSATAVRMGLCASIEVAKDGPEPTPRDKGKILNYSINYGKTDAGLGVQIQDEDGNGIGAAAGQELLDNFYEARPGIARFHRDIVKYAEAKGGVRSLLGRFRPIDQPYRVWSHRKKRNVDGPGARQAKNVIQNCATDVVVLAMLRVNTNPELESPWFNKRLADLDCNLLLQNHDELVLEVPEQNAAEAREEAASAMTNCLDGVREFLCPLGVDGGYGPNWGACKGA